MKEDIQARIGQLRDVMRSEGVDATVIPQTDPHQGEYLASHWQVRRWLSGFTGSAGDLVVTLSGAWIWADSRYWLQAAQQLEGTGIAVMEEGKPSTPSILDFLTSNLSKGSTVGIDGMLFAINATREMKKRLDAAGLKLKVDFAPIDAIWTDRPALPSDAVFIHDEKYSGESLSSKVQRVLENVNRSDADGVFISDLAEIAWTLNLRSSDVSCNPVVTSFLYLGPGGGVLFVDPAKLSSEVTEYLAHGGVACRPYTEALQYLSLLPIDEKVLLSTSQSAGALLEVLGSRAVEGTSPVAMLKAVKNDTQLRGVRDAMVRDGVAMVRSLIEIEKTIARGDRLTEIGVADILLKYRSASERFFDLSFETIAGFGPHGAIVHYSATEESDAVVTADSLLLIDSGANYLDGTTDITRTIALGTPTQAQRHDFTLVMKGHIALATAVFPEGTRGAQLDALARINLWKEGLSYLHGTGHGVGHFLNVHEGPQSIRLNDTLAPMTPGMITSNEPGLYREGEYGIRCENLVLTTDAFTTDFGHFLKFETLTLCPFDIKLFDTSIMSADEIEWVNEYHKTVCDRLLPHLEPSEQEWLLTKTTPIH
ncbi:MAG: aminopeptidase P family protein [Bacteroides sp.]|nr:aminopeptidase P family protein [Bacteroides sp.]MCM1412936.1 aminopeptidase P family protein [Bacteroides sp.]MCM1471621.1 aminopeptidase P family protein [Bacteroides sp.]